MLAHFKFNKLEDKYPKEVVFLLLEKIQSLEKLYNLELTDSQRMIQEIQKMQFMQH